MSLPEAIFPTPNDQPLQPFSGEPTRVNRPMNQIGAANGQCRCQFATAVPYFRLGEPTRGYCCDISELSVLKDGKIARG